MVEWLHPSWGIAKPRPPPLPPLAIPAPRPVVDARASIREAFDAAADRTTGLLSSTKLREVFNAAGYAGSSFSARGGRVAVTTGVTDMEILALLRGAGVSDRDLARGVGLARNDVERW
jgi:hypothetical protein